MAFDLLYLLILTLVAAGLGLAVLRLFQEVPAHFTNALALSLPLGLGAIGLTTLLLGELGQLNPNAIVGMIALFGLISAANLNHFAQMLNHHPPGRPNLSIFDIFLCIVVLGTFITALTPVTDGDALCYHLQVPKVFLAKGVVGFEPDLHETIYPLLTEMLYADALALRGPVACRLTQWLLGVVFALNVAAMARPMLGDRARWAGTIALLVPAVSNGMGAPLNDVALAAFGNAAIYGWTRWLDKRTLGRAVVAGLLAGLAIGVKYPALVLAGLLGIAMCITAFRQRRRDEDAEVTGTGQSWEIRHIQDRFYINPLDVINFERKVGRYVTPAKRYYLGQVFLFGAVAFLTGCCWYFRAYLYTGNPVFPFFRQFFGGSGLDEVLDPIKRPLQITFWNMISALGHMTLDPGRFDSFPHQFGPLFLLMLPALLIERPSRRVWQIVLLGYLFLTICMTQRQSMRFLLIAVGPMSVGVAWLACRWWDRRTLPARLLVLVLSLCLAFEATISLGRTRHGLSVVFGRETESQYLERQEPTFRVGRWIDQHLDAKARLVGQDHRGFYIPRAYAMELAYRRRTGLGTHDETPELIVETLRRDGFTHLLLCPPEPVDSVEFDPTLSQKLARWLEKQTPVYREAITDPDGVTRHYAIYVLDEPRPIVGTAAWLMPR